MGFKEVFQAVGQTIFAAFGNVKRTDLVYVAKADSYTPGTTGVSEDDTNHDIEGYLLEYTSEEIDGKIILATDRRLLLLVQDYPLITPKMGDELQADGDIWRVIRKYKDAADVCWDIQLRLPT